MRITCLSSRTYSLSSSTLTIIYGLYITLLSPHLPWKMESRFSFSYSFHPLLWLWCLEVSCVSCSFPGFLSLYLSSHFFFISCIQFLSLLRQMPSPGETEEVKFLYHLNNRHEEWGKFKWKYMLKSCCYSSKTTNEWMKGSYTDGISRNERNDNASWNLFSSLFMNQTLCSYICIQTLNIVWKL